jgi:hypothetical protein
MLTFYEREFKRNKARRIVTELWRTLGGLGGGFASTKRIRHPPAARYLRTVASNSTRGINCKICEKMLQTRVKG